MYNVWDILAIGGSQDSVQKEKKMSKYKEIRMQKVHVYFTLLLLINVVLKKNLKGVNNCSLNCEYKRE